ncbi:Hypothetical protein NGAL_HAMBI2605_59410 [Neorhizobium galegae bv. orientalis]|nr:Hypothetical protein NGAL_HAMBI2605_59410 [Neorhizobium galegae bv. orientalis]
MKTKLDCMAEILAAQSNCPHCSSSLAHQYWDQEHFPGELSDPGYLANADDKLAICFDCSAEFSIDETDQIVCRTTCPSAGDAIARTMQYEADEIFDEQVDIACRQCGCTDEHACVTDGTPCHWVEPDLCSACAGKAVAA